jgi:hypothetical protein
MEELITAYRLTNDKLRDIPTVYITTPQILRSGPYPHSNHQHLIDPTSSGGPAAIADKLVRLMGDELVQHCQKAWDINKTLYPDHWRHLDETLCAGDTGRDALPEVPEAIAAALQGVPVTEFMLADLGKISSEMNQSILLAILASLWARIDDLDARLLGSHVGHALSPGFLASAISEVGPKTYAPDETIADVSSVLRSAARIANAVSNMRCAEAFDIARRYTWPATRQVLLCAVYAAAAEMGDDETRRNICKELGIAGFAPRQPRPSFMAKIFRVFSRR